MFAPFRCAGQGVLKKDDGREYPAIALLVDDVSD
jgi:hypothetical protein